MLGSHMCNHSHTIINVENIYLIKGKMTRQHGTVEGKSNVLQQHGVQPYGTTNIVLRIPRSIYKKHFLRSE